MKNEFIDGLIKGIENEITSKSKLSIEEKEKLKNIKSQLKSNSKNLKTIRNKKVDQKTILEILQAIVLLIELMREISPHIR